MNKSIENKFNTQTNPFALIIWGKAVKNRVSSLGKSHFSSASGSWGWGRMF